MTEEHNHLTTNNLNYQHQYITSQFNQNHQQNPLLNQLKTNVMPQQSRPRSRITIKKTTFNSQAHEVRFNHYLQNAQRDPRNTKAEKENIQVRQFKKKLKRVGKKVWVTAFKESIEQDNSQKYVCQEKSKKQEKVVDQLKNEKKEQFNTHESQSKDNQNFEDFQECTSQIQTQKNNNIISSPTKVYKSESPRGDKEILLIKSILQNIKVEEAVERSREYLKNIAQFKTNQVTQRGLELRCEKSGKGYTGSGKFVGKVDNDGYNKDRGEDRIGENDTECDPNIQKMLQEIEQLHMNNQPQLYCRNSKMNSQLNQNVKQEKVEVAAKSVTVGRKSFMKKQDYKSKKRISVKNSEQPQIINKTAKRQSISLHAKISKKPLPPTANFRMQPTRNMLGSEHVKKSAVQVIKETNIRRESTVLDTPISMTNSKVELVKIRVRQQATPQISTKSSGIFQSLHSSQKKQIGNKKMGIQKFKNADVSQAGKIGNSLKKNKNLQINWYISEAKRQITSYPYATPV